MEALKNFPGYRQRLFLTNDLNKWVSMVGWGGGGYSCFQVKWGIERFFWVWNFRFRDFFGYDFISVGIFCVFKTILSCHSYIIDETEDVLGCPECCLGFVGNPWFFFGGRVDFCPHSIIPSLEIRSTPLENWVSKKGVAKFEITQIAFAHLRQ